LILKQERKEFYAPFLQNKVHELLNVKFSDRYANTYKDFIHLRNPS